MSMISKDILRKVNSLKDNVDEIYTFVCDNGQEFCMLIPEQLELIMMEQAKMIRDEMLKKKKNESNKGRKSPN